MKTFYACFSNCGLAATPPAPEYGINRPGKGLIQNVFIAAEQTQRKLRL